MRISAVIPVYNEEDVIDEFASRLLKTLEKTVTDYEVIFVVEGDDRTLEKLKDLSASNHKVRLEYCEKRLGLGKALKKGLYLIGPETDYVLTMDADLNHQPEEIGKLLEAIDDADIVVGSRLTEQKLAGKLPFFKRIVSGATNWIVRNSFKIPSKDVTSGFRLYSTRAVEEIREDLTSTNFEVAAELLIRARRKGLRMKEVPITFLPRPRGTSKLSFFRSGIGYARLIAKLRF